MSTSESQIRDLLATYERALNTSDADLAASCYAADGSFMPTTLPTVTGGELADGYRRIFDAIRLDVTFTIDELAVTSDETTYALTRSGGTQTVCAFGPSPRRACCSSNVRRSSLWVTDRWANGDACRRFSC